jgi:hypothetical protein
MLVESDFNSMLKQSLLFSGILNKVDQMESRLVKQDEKISNIRKKYKVSVRCYVFKLIIMKKEIVLIQVMNLLIMVKTSETQIHLSTITQNLKTHLLLFNLFFNFKT